MTENEETESTKDVSRSVRLLLYFVYFVLGVFFMIHLSGWLVDDSYISFRYSRNLANSYGLVFNPGGYRVEGYTNFSWVLLGALVHKMGVAQTFVMPFFGALCALGSMVFAALISRDMVARNQGTEHETRTPWAAVITSGLLASNISLFFYSITGLETALFSLVVLGGIWAAVSARINSWWVWALLALLTRPEAPLLWGFGIVFFARTHPIKVVLAKVIAPLVAGGALYVLFKWLTFGTLLPNTFYAKLPNFKEGLLYVAQAWTLFVPLLALTIIGLYSGKKSRSILFVFIFAFVWLLAVILEGGDWMPMYRMLIIPMLIISTGIGALLATSTWTKPIRIATGVAFCCWLAASANMLSQGSEYTSVMARGDIARDKAIRQILQGKPKSIGTFDIGLVGWLAADSTIIDLGGLTDAVIARTGRGYYYKEPPEAYIAQVSPDIFVLTTHVAPEVDPVTHGVSIASVHHAERVVQEQNYFITQYRYAGTLDIELAFLHVFIHQRLLPPPKPTPLL